jgi:hypothetical protein
MPVTRSARKTTFIGKPQDYRKKTERPLPAKWSTEPEEAVAYFGTLY